MPKIGILLSGSGVFDGSEITEVVLTILALEQRGCQIVFLGLDEDQYHVVNHLTQEEQEESRHVCVESARLTRGRPVENLAKYSLLELDALLVPGGFGVAKTLCNFARTQGDFEVNQIVSDALRFFVQQQKPLGFCCIAPVIAAKLFRDVTLTIGEDKQIAKRLETIGANHQVCLATEIVICETYNIVTTPAFMLSVTSDKVEKGISKWVQAVIDRI